MSSFISRRISFVSSSLYFSSNSSNFVSEGRVKNESSQGFIPSIYSNAVAMLVSFDSARHGGGAPSSRRRLRSAAIRRERTGTRWLCPGCGACICFSCSVHMKAYSPKCPKCGEKLSWKDRTLFLKALFYTLSLLTARARLKRNANSTPQYDSHYEKRSCL